MAKVGRPSKFDPSYCDEARRLAILGATDEEMAEFWSVDISTFYRWKLDHPEFCVALKEGKIKADTEVAESLYKRALGHVGPSQTVMTETGPVEVDGKYFPPDVTAQIFWLKNRRRMQWRDQQDHDVTGNLQVEERKMLDITALSWEQRDQLEQILLTVRPKEGT